MIVLDREYACDLVVTPAVRRGQWIVLRLTPMRFFLWGKIMETEHLEREATKTALHWYGWDPAHSPAGQLERIARGELESVLHHELGEARDREFPVTRWGELISRFPHSRIEVYLRSLKDLLGDTHPAGTLRYIIRHRKNGSFAFYVSNLKGMSRLMAPEIVEAFTCFPKEPDWSLIEKTRRLLRRRFAAAARRIRALSAELLPGQPDRFQQALEAEFLKPLKL